MMTLLDRCIGSCDTLNDLFEWKYAFQNKGEDLNLSIFNIITGINESKPLTKHIYHANVNVNIMVENVIQIKSGIMINVDVGVKICKNIMCTKKEYIWNPVACSCGNGKYLGNIIDDSLIMFDDIIDTIVTIVLW